jgi:two-component system sensor histidine kinase EvgS
VADDCALQRRLLERQLKNTNATLFQAVSGEEALAISRRVVFDVIILDLQLGGLDGLMTSQALRQEGYKGMILGLSAHFNDAQTRFASQKGMNELLQKPLHRTALLRVLSENLVGHGSIRRAG